MSNEASVAALYVQHDLTQQLDAKDGGHAGRRGNNTQSILKLSKS